jgi:hypothetical protein
MSYVRLRSWVPAEDRPRTGSSVRGAVHVARHLLASSHHQSDRVRQQAPGRGLGPVLIAPITRGPSCLIAFGDGLHACMAVRDHELVGQRKPAIKFGPPNCSFCRSRARGTN